MDNQTSLLIGSVVINILLVIERIMKRAKKSSCMGSTIEFETPKNVDSQIENTSGINGVSLEQISIGKQNLQIINNLDEKNIT